jgi:hypothetical protein
VIEQAPASYLEGRKEGKGGREGREREEGEEQNGGKERKEGRKEISHGIKAGRKGERKEGNTGIQE